MRQTVHNPAIAGLYCLSGLGQDNHLSLLGETVILYNLGMLTPESIELYKERLEKDRLRLVKKAEKESRPEDFGGEAMDPEDEEADEAEEYANDLATSEVLKGRVNEIDAALNKMREGKYGICENCGREIPKEVLDLVPESQYCDNCKK